MKVVSRLVLLGSYCRLIYLLMAEDNDVVLDEVLNPLMDDVVAEPVAPRPFPDSLPATLIFESYPYTISKRYWAAKGQPVCSGAYVCRCWRSKSCGAKLAIKVTFDNDFQAVLSIAHTKKGVHVCGAEQLNVEMYDARDEMRERVTHLALSHLDKNALELAKEVVSEFHTLYSGKLYVFLSA